MSSSFISPSASKGTERSRNPSAWSREAQDEFLASEPKTYTGLCIQAALRKFRNQEQDRIRRYREWKEAFKNSERASRIYP